MDAFERFILEHSDADIPRLLLSCKEWPDDRDLVASTLEARSKLRKKVPEWYAKASLRYPDALCAEQCSSSVTAAWKAALAERIIEGGDGRIADLAGGLGVDSWAFSKVASEVLYNERSKALADAAVYNYSELGAGGIRVSNVELTPATLPGILLGFNPDLIYLDPARRACDGRKVFLLEDCSPDVLGLLPGLMAACRHLLLKLSPMADIGMVVDRLDKTYEEYLEKVSGAGWNGRWIREVHVVATGGECKELLVWMDREWNGAYSVTCREDGGTLTFPSVEIAEAKAVLPESAYADFLFEPGKSLMKAGLFNAVCSHFGLVKLARFTHLYTFGESLPEGELRARIEELNRFGKVFKVKEFLPMDKASMKAVGKRWPHSGVTARNIPLSSDELRARLGVSAGDDAHIFGARVELPFQSGNFLIVCDKV